MLQMAVGHGVEVSADKAMASAIGQCRAQLGGEMPAAGILYTSFIDEDHARLLKATLEAFPGMQLVGCTTDGEVSSDTGFSEQSVLLTVFRSDELEFVTGAGEGYSGNPFEVAGEAVRQAVGKAGKKPALCIAMPDGLTTIGFPVIESLRDALGAIPAFGGTAGDRFKLVKTYQFHGDRVLSDGFVFMLICGDLKFSSGVCSGWTPLGKKHVPTDFEGNLIRRIGDRTAMEFYEHYLGPNEKSFIQFPLAVFPEGEDTFVLRDPLVFDKETGGISFVGTFPDKCTVQLSEAGRDDLVEAARTATRTALATYPGKMPEAGLIFSCCSRHIILGSRTEEEHTQVTELVDAKLPVAGFYTYGEIAPLRPGGVTRYHNDTFVLLLMGTK